MKLGILGDGQLARMLALAAYPLGIETVCYGSDVTGSAGQVTQVMLGQLDDTQRLQQFAQSVDVVTFETENIPLYAVEAIENVVDIYPSKLALQTAQDRLLEKNTLRSLGVSTANFAAVNSLRELLAALDEIAVPSVLKTTRFGYDGKGQFVLRSIADAEKAWQAMNGQAAILEQFVVFERELSLLAVRDRSGETCFYPLVENVHREGILRVSKAPFEHVTLQQQAETIAQKLLDHFRYVGVFCIEFFQDGDKLLVNEIAPRVHNSGHWTIEGAVSSQFENHVRAVCGFSVGSAESIGYSAMVNCIGDLFDKQAMLSYPHAHFHDYGKSARPARKVGHVTVNAPTKERVIEILAQITNQ